MKKTTRKLIKRVSTIEIPGFPLPMILVHGLEAQTMLGEQMIHGVAPMDGEGKAHRLLAFTVTRRFDIEHDRSQYLAHLLYERGHLLEVQIAEDFGAILMAILWAKSGTRADADAALKARVEAAYRLEAANADRLADASQALEDCQRSVERLQRERAEEEDLRPQVATLQRQVAAISSARTAALTRAQQAETALLTARAELLTATQDLARGGGHGTGADVATAELNLNRSTRRTSFLPGPRPAPTPPAPPEGSRFSLLEID